MSAIKAGPNPQTVPKLSAALGQVLSAACQLFVDRVFMEPGVVCAVVPPAMTGTVAGVGRLMGPGPTGLEVKLEAERAARATGMSAADQQAFVKALESMVPKAFDRFRDLAQVLPGTPVAGGVTLAPAHITVGVGAITAELKVLALTLNPPHAGGGWVAARPQAQRPGGMPVMGGHRGAAPLPPAGPPAVALPTDFGQAAAVVMGQTLEQLATLVMVSPGIPLAGPVTAAPGRLM